MYSPNFRPDDQKTPFHCDQELNEAIAVHLYPSDADGHAVKSKRKWLLLGLSAILIAAAVTGVGVYFATKGDNLNANQNSNNNSGGSIRNGDASPSPMTPTTPALTTDGPHSVTLRRIQERGTLSCGILDASLDNGFSAELVSVSHLSYLPLCGPALDRVP